MVAAFGLVFVFWDMKPVFYALWSPFTFLMGYSDPRRPTDDKLAGTRPQTRTMQSRLRRFSTAHPSGP